MRFGIDARLTYHQRAGIGRYTLFLLDELAKADHENRYTIFQHRKDREPLVVAPNFQRKTLYTPVHSRMEQPLLMAELLFHNLDLIHCTDFIPPLYSNLPSIITVHDLAFLRWPHFLTKDHATYYSQIDRGVRHARHIIVPSHSTKNDVIGQLGVPESKISVIYEAAASLYRPMPIDQAQAAVSKRFSVPTNYILFVSTIEPRKNIDGLLQAFHHLRTKYNLTDTALVLAGKQGWLSEKVYETVETLGLQDSTFFVGRVTDEELHHLYVARALPRTPCLLRRLWPAAPGGNGLRHAHGGEQHQQPARSGGRRRPAGGPQQLGRDGSCHSPPADGQRPSRRDAPEGFAAGCRIQLSRAAAETLDVYQAVVEGQRVQVAPGQ
jgi:glycosyltransferase involved in cell wall biosynthesis